MTDEFLMSKTRRSASYPTAILPLGTENSLPGFSAPMRTACAIGITSLRTMSITIGIVVSTPGIPPGAASNSCAFSSAVCGAWSDPNMSMSPDRNLLNSRSRQSMSLSGGLTLYSAPGQRSTSNIMWCIVTSVVNPAAFAMSRPSGVVRWHMLILDPPKLEASLRMAVHSASAGRFLRWSRVHLSTSRDMRWSSSAWTLILLPVASTSLTEGIISSSSSSSMFPVVDPMKSLNAGTRGAIMPALTLAVTAANRP